MESGSAAGPKALQIAGTATDTAYIFATLPVYISSSATTDIYFSLCVKSSGQGTYSNIPIMGFGYSAAAGNTVFDLRLAQAASGSWALEGYAATVSSQITISLNTKYDIHLHIVGGGTSTLYVGASSATFTAQTRYANTIAFGDYASPVAESF